MSRRASEGASPVLIVGLSTRALAESASRAGYDAASIDAFGDLDQRARVPNVSLFRDLGRRWSAAAAVAVAQRFPGRAVVYGSNFENHPIAVQRLARERELLGNSAATLRLARDPARLRDVVTEAGGRFPRTLAPDEAGAPRSGGRWLRKPRQGGGGGGVADWAPGARLGRHGIVQERIDGELGSVAFAADGRRAVVLGFARGLAGDPAFGAVGHRYCGSLYPFRIEASLAARLDAIVQAVTREFGLVGVNGLDFVARDGEPFVLELNPRYCASMELFERATGASVFDVHVNACRGALPEATAPPPEGAWGKAILWARARTVAPDTRAWLTRDDVRDVPAPGETIQRGHPVCTVFATGPDTPSCYRRLVETGDALA